MTTEPNREPTAAEAELWDRLGRYVGGESPPDEAAEVRAWLAADPRRQHLLDALLRSLQSLPAAAPADIDVEAALARVTSRLDEADVRPITPAPSPRRRPWAALIRAAALVTLILGAGIIWRAIQQREGTTLVAARIYEAAVGAVDSISLADGTRVLLAPGSRLNVAANYGVSTYDVELTGEALFDVSQAAAGAFTVRANGATVTDLGTTFTVRNHARDEVRVIVTSGSVLMRGSAAADTGTVLRAGDRGVVTGGGAVVAERGAASSDDLAWTSGRLVFTNATLAEVAAELRRWYGVELEFAEPSLAIRHFTATFAGEDAAHVLSVIELAVGVRIERSGNTATVHPSQDTISR